MEIEAEGEREEEELTEGERGGLDGDCTISDLRGRSVSWRMRHSGSSFWSFLRALRDWFTV